MTDTTLTDPGCAAPASRAKRNRGIWLATAGVGTLVAWTVVGEAAAYSRPALSLLVLDVVLGAVGCALLPLLFRWPVPVALALAGLAALSPAATPLSATGTLQVARARRHRTALMVAHAGVGAHLVQGAWRPRPGLPYGWWLVLVVAVHAGLVGWGWLGQARSALICSLRERALRAEAEQAQRVAEARLLERTRIAREMHDVLAHRLSLLATYAGALEFRPDAPPEQLSRAAGVVRTGAHQALEELREVISVLRDDAAGEPSRGEPTEAAARPQPTIADIPRLIEESRDAGVVVALERPLPDPAGVPAGTGRAAYRIVQEGLTNARKHAAGQPVHLALRGQAGEELVIDIRNALAGDPYARPAVPGSGTGLVGISERVQLAGGRLDHGVTPTGEFRLCASLPWPA